MEEQVIVSLTSYGRRLGNLPEVLNTIFQQTRKPDKVVLNLAFEEVLPENVEDYLAENRVEINRVADTKVYKKIIPTLLRYPNDCVIGIDDDWLYPPQMIEDFMEVHRQFPDNPISGNRVIYENLQCHCGCASLVKASWFGDYLGEINDELMKNCLSDDVVYTYFLAKAGRVYVRTQDEYFINMQAYNSLDSYSDNNDNAIDDTYSFLVQKYGCVDKPYMSYFSMNYYAVIVDIIQHCNAKIQHLNCSIDAICGSRAYRLGRFVLAPFRWIKRMLK